MVIEMRLDKYLKISRVIKRRTLAKDIIDVGLVTINGKTSKPSSEVKENDVLVLSLGERRLIIEVTSILPYSKKEDTSKMYKIISDEVIK